MASRDHSDVSLEAAPAAVMTIERKRKKTMGRQKIEIKRIASEEKRQVCFSKRKDGLFKKASDLSALCGAHVAVVAFSPGGKPFSFGHPSVDALVGRFTDPAAPGAMGPAPVHSALLEEFSREEELLAKALAAEASRKKALEAAICQAGVWTGDADVKSASPNDVLAMRSALERVQAEVAERLQEFMAEEAMMQLTASAGLFVADGGVSSHHRDQVVMDEQKMMAMGGNVDHALPFAAMMLPLPPYDHCFDLNHGPVFEVEGFYGAMACSPFQ